MMVVLLIMTIILAAMAPVMTTRMSANKAVGGNSKSEIWKYVEDSGETDIYYGTTNNQRAMIGQNKAETAENARLILNTSDDIPNHLIFRKGENTLGLLTFDTNNNIILGTDNAIDKVASSIVIGKDANISSNCIKNHSNFIAIGTNATAKKSNYCTNGLEASGDIAIGTNAHAETNTSYGTQTLSGNVAIGTNAQAYDTNTIAIGTGAIVNSNYDSSHSLAIGENAKAERYKQVVIGYKANATNNSGIAIGSEAKTSSGNSGPAYTSMAIGPEAEAAERNAIAIGNQAKATGGYSVAIGFMDPQGLEVTGYRAIGILGRASGSGAIGIGGTATKEYGIAISGASYGEYGIAIGYNAIAGNKSIAIGRYACWNRGGGENVVCIGDEAGKSDFSTSKSNLFYLGNSAHQIIISGDVSIAKTLAVAGISVPSDKKLKNIGKEYTSSLDKIKQLKPFNFTYKNDKNKTPRVGVIAQDLQKVFPNAVSKGKDGFLTIRMEDMFYAVINAIKELDAKITQMMKQESEKDKKIKDLEKRIEFLEQKLMQSP